VNSPEFSIGNLPMQFTTVSVDEAGSQIAHPISIEPSSEEPNFDSTVIIRADRRARWPNLTDKLENLLNSEKSALYLPWTITKYNDSLKDFRVLAQQVGLVLIQAPEKSSGDTTGAFLAHLSKAALPLFENRKQKAALEETCRAVSHLPESPELVACAISRLSAAFAGTRLMLLSTEEDVTSNMWLAWALSALKRMRVKSIIVVGWVPKSEKAKIIRLTLSEMAADLGEIAKEEPEEKALSKQGVEGRTGLPRFFKNQLAKLRWNKHLVVDQAGASGVRATTTASPDGLASGERMREWAAQFSRSVKSKKLDPWHSTIVRMAYPNISLAEGILARDFSRADEKIDRLTLQAADHSLLKAGAEDRLVLCGRLRFIVALARFFPSLIDSVRYELDGADQLYRLLLILGGWTPNDSLLSSALLPDWQPYLNNYVFSELVRSMYQEEDGCKVKRFESRSQLFWHVCLWSDDDAGSQRRRNFDIVLRNFTEWVADLESLTSRFSDDSYDSLVRKIRAPSFYSHTFHSMASGHEVHSAELLQLAQMLLSADELLDGVAHYDRIDELLTRATNLSRGAIYVDTTLIKARALTLRDRFSEAVKILRLAKRLGDPLTRTAIGIEEAHIFERKRDYWEAIRRYRLALNEAEAVAADELTARASLGWLRCDALSTLMRDKIFDAERIRLRVRCLVQVQSARAPDLFALSRREQPIVFLSYRSITRDLTAQVNDLLKQTGLTPYLDCDSAKDAAGIWTSQRDFGAAIHKNLLDADAVVLFLSERFFDSPWCVHELHFALGQHEVRGVLIFWTWCESLASLPEKDSSDERSSRSQPRSPLEAARDWASRPLGKNAREGDKEYHRYHEQDRLLRVINHGLCLTDDVVRIDDSGSEKVTALHIVEQLKLYEGELRTRAGLVAKANVRD
jgi:hypothetical protein